MSSRKERLIYVGISVENIIAPSVRDHDQTFPPDKYVPVDVCNRLFVDSQVVEEEQKPEIIKEKKEVKRSKSSGRRSTRAKKSISYRSEMGFYWLHVIYFLFK